MDSLIPVIDVFAGPGGLNEGFSAVNSGHTFSTAASIEMDVMACRTLVLRAAVRRALRHDGALPESYWQFVRTKQLALDPLEDDESFRVHLKEAREEVHRHELSTDSREESDAIIASALAAQSATDPWVLVGGPPCQAYSLAGRSRRVNDDTFATDKKHTLYREYLHIIEKFAPAVFVMENVKGMLSSTHAGGRIFDAIRRDLTTATEHGYELRSFIVPGRDAELKPGDFVIHAEDYGIPQRRHRVIILGVRGDLAGRGHRTLERAPQVSVGEVIGHLPRIRSGLSPRPRDSWINWLEAQLVGLNQAGRKVRSSEELPLGGAFDPFFDVHADSELGRWLRLESDRGLSQHESRHHMAGDLARYAFLAESARRDGTQVRVNDLPPALLPDHRNARREDAPFADRFRVQIADRPSSTVTSHIAKDGHYYIHPDPLQTRSLTVREAARLQTFPDNYFFMGNRTQQYHQVGNAVPPFLARQIGEIVAGILGIEGG